MKKKLPLFILCFATWFANGQSSCETAQVVTAGRHFVSQYTGTANPYAICTGGLTASNTQWYRYLAPTNTSVTLTTDLLNNIGRDTRFHVYTGTCGNLTCFAGDDDSGNLGTGYLSAATFNVTAGTYYYIVFDNRWSPLAFEFVIAQGPYTPEQPVAPVSLIGFTPRSIALTGSYKNCAVDMNGDYLDDIVGISSNALNIHYQNLDGSFTSTNITLPTVTFLPSWSVSAGDIDKNGFNDLLLGSGSGVTFLKANSNGTAYTQISGTQYVFSQRSNFVDINNDGHLDAFVCHDVNPNVFYTNDGQGNLTYHQGGMGDFASGGNYGSIFVDYDNDGDQDLFIAKCRGGNTGAHIDELHRNNGDGTFTNVAVAAGMADPGQSWSSAWGDFDNDGDMDAMIGSNDASTGQKLMRNNGNGTFTDVTLNSGLDTYTSIGREYIARDFNNDGFIDILGPGNVIMINNGNMTFTQSGGAPSTGSVGDFNNDGFLDVQNANSLYINNKNNNNWLKFTLKGIQSNGNGIGARIEIYGAWGKQIRDVRSGEGFQYTHSLNTHFGIGTATTITKAVIKWPSGLVETILNPTMNSTIHVIEGGTLGVSENNNNQFTIYPNPAKDIISVQLKQSSSEISEVKIYDLNGRLSLQPNSNQNTINVESLATGTYLLILKNTDGNKYSQKFIKQ